MSAKMNPRKTRRRNAGGARRFLSKLPPPPTWQDVVATVAGGGGTAVLGGWLANRGWDPSLVGLGLGVAGAVASLTVPAGPARVAAAGVAAAGASQFALTMMHKQAVDQIKSELAGRKDPSNAAFPPGISSAFHRRQLLEARTIDDEERLTDPDLEYDAVA